MNQQAMRTFSKPFKTITALLISAALANPVQAQDWKAVGEFGPSSTPRPSAGLASCNRNNDLQALVVK